MNVLFRHHDLLRLFVEIAGYPSFSEAADEMNMTKGAISYQIKTLEADLGLPLFKRTTRGVSLTSEGLGVLTACQTHYEQIEANLEGLKGLATKSLTIGVSTYFAARWLSGVLMSFMQDHQNVQIRIQPLIQFSQNELQEVDLAIRWGDGEWRDVEVSSFLPMPAFPVGNRSTRKLVDEIGLENALASFTLLRDRDDSNAWSDWQSLAGLPLQSRRDVLIVPDPNVRVQSVIDGQGVALMDRLVQSELREEKLFRLSDKALEDYGYFLIRSRRKPVSDMALVFSEWILNQV